VSNEEENVNPRVTFPWQGCSDMVRQKKTPKGSLTLPKKEKKMRLANSISPSRPGDPLNQGRVIGRGGGEG